MILRSERVLPWAQSRQPLSASIRRSASSTRSGRKLPAVELVVAVVVAAHRGKVRPRLRSGVVGRSGKFVGYVEGLVGVGESRVGVGELGASMTSTEQARVVEVALSEASCVLGQRDERRGGIDDVVEGSTRCGGCCEISFGLLNSGRSLLSSCLGVFEGSLGVAEFAGSCRCSSLNQSGIWHLGCRRGWWSCSASCRRWVTAGMSARSLAMIASRTSRASATSWVSVTTSTRLSCCATGDRHVQAAAGGGWRGEGDADGLGVGLVAGFGGGVAEADVFADVVGGEGDGAVSAELGHGQNRRQCRCR